jgi:DNA-binding TFAR19-related protein (PDSD5 family)
MDDTLSTDKELDYLKRKKLLELRKRLIEKQIADSQKQKQKEQQPKKPIDILKTIFGENAWDVWRIAEQQHPKTTKTVANTLVTLLKAGKIREKITGEQISSLFTQLGVPLRFKTKIRIFEGGELKTIADKLREK